MNNQKIEVALLVDTENKELFIRFSGFKTSEDAIDYSEFLIEYLAPLLTYKEVVH